MDTITPNWVKVDTADVNLAITCDVLIEQINELLLKSVQVADDVTSITDGRVITT